MFVAIHTMFDEYIWRANILISKRMNEYHVVLQTVTYQTQGSVILYKTYIHKLNIYIGYEIK